jgi:RNA polymerase-binding transcription factor DksA
MSTSVDVRHTQGDHHLSAEALAVLRRELCSEVLRQLVQGDEQAALVAELTGQPEVHELEREAAESAVARAHQAVSELEQALGRLDDGSYGVCEECRAAIPLERLLAIPQVRTCRECADPRAGSLG